MAYNPYQMNMGMGMGMNQSASPYQPYLDRLAAMQQPQMPQMQITRVNGRPGAEAFQMPPNSAILLLDEQNPVVWLKTTDGAGYATVTPYTITPFQAEPQPDYSSLEERIRKLEAKLNEPDPECTPRQGGKRRSADGPDTNVGTK